MSILSFYLWPWYPRLRQNIVPAERRRTYCSLDGRCAGAFVLVWLPVFVVGPRGHVLCGAGQVRQTLRCQPQEVLGRILLWGNNKRPVNYPVISRSRKHSRVNSGWSRVPNPKTTWSIHSPFPGVWGEFTCQGYRANLNLRVFFFPWWISIS